MDELSNRGHEWLEFSDAVFGHIEEYTVPQYGDSPDDQASSFTVDEIKMNMKRYVNRIGTNARGPNEAIRDSIKLAHYSCMLFNKLMEARDASNPSV